MLDVAGRALTDVREAVSTVGKTVEGVLAAGRSAATVRPVQPLNDRMVQASGR